MKIPLNRPFLPPKKEFDAYTDKIWQRNWLTNHGPLVQQFEKNISEYLKLPDFVFMNNGTTSLLVALKALYITGDVITTPYSYVATTGSILWQNCRPVFADIEADSLTIDPARIETLITDQTSAILATHVYGNPCDVEAIQKIAEKHQLKVIYDAAHCFGVTYKGKSILQWGDASILSFHATKLFHTIEGGGFYSINHSIMEKARYMMNFGHDGPYHYRGEGINGKNSEFHAAMGLCNLSYVSEIMERRKQQVYQYKQELMEVNVQYQMIRDNTDTNYAYFPVIFKTAETSLKAEEHLAQMEVETRRYFKPSLNKLNFLEDQDSLPVAEDLSERVLCLPLFHELTSKEISYVCAGIRDVFQ
jgi:dTDP-4-amino-4,6-dideoxygalactose transaminase